VLANRAECSFTSWYTTLANPKNANADGPSRPYILIRMKDRTTRTIHRRLLFGALVCAVLLIVGYVLMVSTAWGHQVDDEAYFGRKALSRRVIKLDSDLLDHVSKATLLLAASVLLAIAAVRRCMLVGVISVIGCACAVIGAEVLKHSLPWRALVHDDSFLERNLRNETYPSGHATIGTSLALSLILISPSRWRPWLAVAAGWMSATFATSVLFAGWHRPSDALGALAWSGFCMTLTATLAIQVRGQPQPATAHPKRALLSSLALAILVAGATWLIAAAAAPAYPFGDRPFFVLTGLIIAGAFSLMAWYGWELRAVDWPANSALRFEEKA
jgi:membrane-associated phospholipid phosphatase